MAQGPSPIVQALARHPSLDPKAVMAVARQEGLGGGIGDSGHAFGPWQLNNAGGVITGRFQGQSPQQINQWAWSPQGLDYALSGIEKAAGGLRGPQAVNAIVSRFERPADPRGEIARALAAYGGGQSGGGAQGPVLPGAAAPSTNPHLLQILLATRNAVGLGAPGHALTQLLQSRAQSAWGTPGSYGVPDRPPASPTSPPARPSSLGPGLAELLNEGTGGPTHSTGPHIHAAFTDPNLELAAIKWAQAHGLRVAENPYVGSVAPVHAPNSYHTRTFPGLYNGRKLGEAVDVTGPNAQAFYQYLAARRGGPTA